MSRYHLHARLFTGSLAAPVANELQSRESDDRDEVLALAQELVARGLAVWLYEHAHGPGPNGHLAPYRVIAEWGTTHGAQPGSVVARHT